MTQSLTSLEKRIVNALRGGLAPVSRPYLAAAEAAGCTEEEIIAALKSFSASGVVRKVAAVLDSHSVGLASGALVAWEVPEEDVERVGKALAEMPGVTHCYARATAPAWPFTVYSMIHASSDDEARAWVGDASARVGITQSVMLFTVDELKKTPPVYKFEDGEESRGQGASGGMKK